ncbi:hypothetical protein LUZ63_019178 [Rhynchospora breviuscula]|uniref:Reverse transcriptase zinc-binding domain-containing protein n=1 Tax=Rhynchospora breviuscula TaxID=2022672 RepID=A0A9Q0C5Q4_9POAL|nr:hypothetical protein LUZ63_019178 [Rhynchospora breviuscula]
MGGLGVKDLQSFGEALFMKVVWSLMSEENKPWVNMCRAKYYPNMGFWRARSKTGCSKMWSQVLKMRERFKDQVFWHIGDGKTVNALSQPWFDLWDVRQVASTKDRHKKVCSLIDGQTTQWNVQELHRLFQLEQVQQIVAGQNKPLPGETQRDRLVWRGSKDGNYSVKEGYKIITRSQSATATVQVTMWPIISKWKGIAPKIKIFLWRLLQRGLPMAVNMHVRLPNFPPICQRCHQENEFETHCLFFCSTSRQVWFGSALGIRVHDLPLNIEPAIQQIAGSLDEEGMKMFATTIWEIWKERNKAVIEHCTFQPQGVLKRINAALTPEIAGINTVLLPNERGPIEKYEVCRDGWQILMDASWAVTGMAGGAYIVYERGKIHSMGLHTIDAQDVFMAEAMVLMEAMKHMYDHLGLAQDTRIQFFSDCLNLVDAVNQGESFDIPSWRATGTVAQIIRQMGGCQHKATLHHARREAIQRAHVLANTARRRAINYRGVPDMGLQQHGCLDTNLEELFFQQVQEAPP